MATTLTPQTDGEPKTAVSASLQKKNQRKKILRFFISLNLKLVTRLSVISMVILAYLSHLSLKEKSQVFKCGSPVFRHSAATDWWSRSYS